jgi:hypothetical protein
MKIKHMVPATLLLFVTTIFGQTAPLETQSQRAARFPETLVETGSDEDHSYIALQTTRQADGRLKITVTSWEDPRFAARLIKQIDGETLQLTLIARCGSVSIGSSTDRWSKTKRSLTESLSAAEESKAAQIVFGSLGIKKSS